ncbi:TlpA family protein disulfide reductase [Neptunitalea chrysea]|uniref:TlpA family protein disulfide reductase n=1 Tax=Neptunitalea chrysea TaxID=1647581 RepID=UPI002490E067|nr:TlpA disulfide reductase family protein [Neptunitalea chrysea]
MSYGLLTKQYTKFSEEVKQGLFQSFIKHTKANVEQYYQQKKEEAKASDLKIGYKAPDFTLSATEDYSFFNLYTSNSEIIVLDFWGSWCSPCISGFPKMKEYYNKYQDKALFVGIACNDTKDAWLKAIKKHELPWTHVINSTKNGKNVAALYKVSQYPTKVILDKDKNVLGIYVGETEDFYKKLDTLLK